MTGFASEATTESVNFSGKVVPSTCTISSDSLNQIVDLGQAQTGQMRAKGQGGKTRFFNIDLENCPEASLADITLEDTGRARMTEDPGKFLVNVGSARGVAIDIHYLNPETKSDTSETLDFSGVIPLTKVVNGKMYSKFSAKMLRIANATVTAGNVSSQIKYQVSYK